MNRVKKCLVHIIPLQERLDATSTVPKHQEAYRTSSPDGFCISRDGYFSADERIAQTHDLSNSVTPVGGGLPFCAVSHVRTERVLVINGAHSSSCVATLAEISRNAVCPIGVFPGLTPPLLAFTHLLSIISPAHSTIMPLFCAASQHLSN